jgi:hypothetical protein
MLVIVAVLVYYHERCSGVLLHDSGETKQLFLTATLFCVYAF